MILLLLALLGDSMPAPGQAAQALSTGSFTPPDVYVGEVTRDYHGDWGQDQSHVTDLVFELIGSPAGPPYQYKAVSGHVVIDIDHRPSLPDAQCHKEFDVGDSWPINSFNIIDSNGTLYYNGQLQTPGFQCAPNLQIGGFLPFSTASGCEQCPDHPLPNDPSLIEGSTDRGAGYGFVDSFEWTFEAVGSGLSASVAVEPDNVQVGEQFEVSITAENAGIENLENVQPVGQLATDGSGAADLISGPDPESVEVLAPGAATTFTYTFLADGPGQIDFSADVEAVVASSLQTVSATAEACPTGGEPCPGRMKIAGKSVVNSTADLPIEPDAGRCYTGRMIIRNGEEEEECTLRALVQYLNSAGDAAVVTFDIPEAGPHRIDIAGSPLPEIDIPISIDGGPQASPASGLPAPGIEINGAGAGADAAGLTLHEDGSEVRGLAINGFSGAAIEATGNSVVIEGNYLGTDLSGTLAVPNGRGVILGVGSGIRVANNLISGNTLWGVLVIDVADSAVIEGNFIGTDLSGAAPLPNGHGIRIDNAGLANLNGNVISGNTGYGVAIAGNLGDRNRLEGNKIGVAANGTTQLPNGEEAVLIEEGANRAAIVQNDILTAGTAIRISGGSDDEVTGNAVTGLPGSDDGISVADGATGVMLGGEVNGNTITGFNKGIVISGSDSQAAIRGNAISDSDELAIDLGDDGQTENDPNDGDVGPNALQNYPVISSAVVREGALRVDITGNSFELGPYTLDIFSSPTCHSSGFGEGEHFLASFQVTKVNGHGELLNLEPLPDTPSGHRWISATATDAQGNTSEFSRCARVADGRKFLTGPATAGEDSIQVSDEAGASRIKTLGADSGFDAGADIVIDAWPGEFDLEPSTETNRIAEAIAQPDGSIILVLTSPLQYDHPAGTTVIVVPSGDTLGDVDCSGTVNAVDALGILRNAAGLDANVDCLAGAGDVDCDGDEDAVDALGVLRHVAGLPVNQAPGCAPIGTAYIAVDAAV